MIIRKFELEDFEDVVSMLYDFSTEVHNNRKINSKYFYYKEVISWLENNKDIVVCIDANTITGFSMCFIENNNYLTEPTYNCDICYVRPKYRKGRTAYLLYNNAVKYAEDIGLKVVTYGRTENGTSDMIAKHFEVKQKFINYEGV